MSCIEKKLSELEHRLGDLMYNRPLSYLYYCLVMILAIRGLAALIGDIAG